MKVYRIRWRPQSIQPVLLGGDLLFRAMTLHIAVQNAEWYLSHLFARLQLEAPDMGYEKGYELLLAQEEEVKK